MLEWGLTELIEAASRTGQRETARVALERLSEGTQASGTDLALGVEARARALLSDDDAADSLYREAIDRLVGRGRARSLPALTLYTANGCGAPTDVWMRANTSASPTGR